MKVRFLPCLLFVAIAGCVGGNSGDRTMLASGLDNSNNATPDDVLNAITTAPVSVRQEMFDYIENEYLWYADLPSVDLSDSKLQICVFYWRICVKFLRIDLVVFQML